MHWDHSWVAGTAFENIRYLILYDYAIHWFDMLQLLLWPNKPPRRVYASDVRSPTQTVAPPLLGQALIEYDAAQASLAFDANTPFGPQDRTYVAGSAGFDQQRRAGRIACRRLTLFTDEGITQPTLTGSWFPDGFHGTMGELLCSIEENRQPTISAAGNLTSLALCFAAVASAARREAITPGSVRQLPSGQK